MEFKSLSRSQPSLNQFSKTNFWAYILGLCWPIQAGLLIYAAQLPMSRAIPLLLVTLALGHFTRKYLQSSQRQYKLSLLLAMLALGNIGMILGWMADFGFGPLIREGVCLCGCPASPIGAGLIARFGWMYKGMVLASLPCFFIIRPNPDSSSTCSPHCPTRKNIGLEIFHAIVCLSGMVIGMFLSCKLLSHWTITNPFDHFIYTYAIMTLGMGIGMIIPCYPFKFNT